MILEYGNMWTAWEQSDLFLITTNACVKPDERLVMGAGIAKQAVEKLPDSVHVWQLKEKNQ